MDWSKGYTSTYYATIVDPVSWRDLDRIEIISGSVVRNTDNLKESASLECRHDQDGIEKWVRIWKDTEQNGEYSHDAIFTGIATTPSNSISGVRRTDSLECYSVLKPAEDVDLLPGWYASRGEDIAKIIKNLLSVTYAPVSVEGVSSLLEDYVVAEDNENHLTMTVKLLSIAGWRLRISGKGEILILDASSKEPVTMFDTNNMDILELDINNEADYFSAPNVFCGIYDSLTAIAKDEDPESELSIPTRGREVWYTENISGLSDDTTLEEYVKSRLKEEQLVQKKASYNRRYIPDIVPEDYILLNYPQQGLVGTYMVSSQNITLSHEGKTKEEVYKYE